MIRLMQIKQSSTNRFDFVQHFAMMVIILIGAAFTLPMVINGSLIHVVASTCAPGQYQQGGQCMAPVVAPVVAERPDVVVDTEAAPADLVDALLDMGYVGDPTDGCECLYVEVGTVIDVPGGLYLATVNGLMVCGDTWFDQECTATGPVVPVSEFASPDSTIEAVD